MDTPIILVTDRNPHVRDFLRREFQAAGLPVRLAKDGYELVERLPGVTGACVLVLDPDLPGLTQPMVLAAIREKSGTDAAAGGHGIVVVLHAFGLPEPTDPLVQAAALVVEKSGDAGPLKAAVERALRQGAAVAAQDQEEQDEEGA